MKIFEKLKVGDIVYRATYDNCNKIRDIIEEIVKSIEKKDGFVVYQIGNKTLSIPKDELCREYYNGLECEYFCNTEKVLKEIELEQYSMNFHYEWLKEKLK